jgi:hypothetical protein
MSLQNKHFNEFGGHLECPICKKEANANYKPFRIIDNNKTYNACEYDCNYCFNSFIGYYEDENNRIMTLIKISDDDYDFTRIKNRLFVLIDPVEAVFIPYYKYESIKSFRNTFLDVFNNKVENILKECKEYNYLYTMSYQNIIPIEIVDAYINNSYTLHELIENLSFYDEYSNDLDNIESVFGLAEYLLYNGLFNVEYVNKLFNMEVE